LIKLANLGCIEGCDRTFKQRVDGSRPSAITLSPVNTGLFLCLFWELKTVPKVCLSFTDYLLQAFGLLNDFGDGKVEIMHLPDRISGVPDDLTQYWLRDSHFYHE
jgi:hypothetical protein